jgi:hypothetical protein
MIPSDFDSIRPGSVVLGLDAAGPADIIQVSDFGRREWIVRGLV